MTNPFPLMLKSIRVYCKTLIRSGLDIIQNIVVVHIYEYIFIMQRKNMKNISELV